MSLQYIQKVIMVKIILFYEGYVLELVLESKDHISNKFNLLGILSILFWVILKSVLFCFRILTDLKR